MPSVGRILALIVIASAFVPNSNGIAKALQKKKFKLAADVLSDRSGLTLRNRTGLSFRIQIESKNRRFGDQTFYLATSSSVKIKSSSDLHFIGDLKGVTIYQSYDNRSFGLDLNDAISSVKTATVFSALEWLYRKLDEEDSIGPVSDLLALLLQIGEKDYDFRRALEVLTKESNIGNANGRELRRLLNKASRVLEATRFLSQGGFLAAVFAADAKRQVIRAIYARAELGNFRAWKIELKDIIGFYTRRLLKRNLPHLTLQLAYAESWLLGSDEVEGWRRDKAVNNIRAVPFSGKVMLRPFPVPLFLTAFRDNKVKFGFEGSSDRLQLRSYGFGLLYQQPASLLKIPSGYYFEAGISLISETFSTMGSGPATAIAFDSPKVKPYGELGWRIGSSVALYIAARVTYLGYEYVAENQNNSVPLPEIVAGVRGGIQYSIF